MANPSTRRGKIFPLLANPGVIDMIGKRVGCLLVLERAPNVNGNARWLCSCQLCGDGCIVEGIRLRSRAMKFDHCPSCRPKRPGRVTRRAVSDA